MRKSKKTVYRIGEADVERLFSDKDFSDRVETACRIQLAAEAGVTPEEFLRLHPRKHETQPNARG